MRFIGALLLLSACICRIHRSHAYSVSGVTELSKTYARLFLPDKQALINISLHFPKNKIVALVGPSGSGKSTLAKLLSGRDGPSSGRVDVVGGVEGVDEVGGVGAVEGVQGVEGMAAALSCNSCAYVDHLFHMTYDENRTIQETLSTVSIHPQFLEIFEKALRRAGIDPSERASNLLVSKRKCFEILLSLARLPSPPPYVLVLDEYLDKELQAVRLKVIV
jgi:ABC-type multidrug transport system ATPase subunit